MTGKQPLMIYPESSSSQRRPHRAKSIRRQFCSLLSTRPGIYTRSNDTGWAAAVVVVLPPKHARQYEDKGPSLVSPLPREKKTSSGLHQVASSPVAHLDPDTTRVSNRRRQKTPFRTPLRTLFALRPREHSTFFPPSLPRESH